LLFGGVYSNLQALQAIAEIASKENIEPENCISIDIVGYCAQPEETVLLKIGKKALQEMLKFNLMKNADDCG
jgi:hypothetical protein